MKKGAFIFLSILYFTLSTSCGIRKLTIEENALVIIPNDLNQLSFSSIVDKTNFSPSIFEPSLNSFNIQYLIKNINGSQLIKGGTMFIKNKQQLKQTYYNMMNAKTINTQEIIEYRNIPSIGIESHVFSINGIGYYYFILSNNYFMEIDVFQLKNEDMNIFNTILVSKIIQNDEYAKKRNL